MAATQTMPAALFGRKVDILSEDTPAPVVQGKGAFDALITSIISQSRARVIGNEQLTSFINDIESDKTVVPLLALGIQDTVRTYYAQRSSGEGVDPEVVSDLSAAAVLAETLIHNVAFFSQEVQELIKVYF